MAKKSGRANDEYPRLYALEGFLLRLAASASSQDFILKGGVLLAAYQLRRPTANIDFAALKTPNDVETIKSMIIFIAVDPGFRVERRISTPQQSCFETVYSRRRPRCFGWAVHTCDRLEIAPGEHRLALLTGSDDAQASRCISSN